MIADTVEKTEKERTCPLLVAVSCLITQPWQATLPLVSQAPSVACDNQGESSSMQQDKFEWLRVSATVSIAISAMLAVQWILNRLERSQLEEIQNPHEASKEHIL